MIPFLFFLLILLITTCHSEHGRVCDGKNGCEIKREPGMCIQNSDCPKWAICSEEEQCVWSIQKIPERVCDGNGCIIKLNDGECFENRDCGMRWRLPSEYFICSEDYRCLLVCTEELKHSDCDLIKNTE